MVAFNNNIQKPTKVDIIDAGGVAIGYLGLGTFLRKYNLESGYRGGQPIAADLVTGAIVPPKQRIPEAIKVLQLPDYIPIEVKPGTENYSKRKKDTTVWIYTSNYQQVVESALKQVGLENRIKHITTTAEKGDRFRKDALSYRELFKEAKQQGLKVGNVVDDTLEFALQALYATIQEKDFNPSSSINVYLVKSDASAEELGQTRYGFYIVNGLNQIGKVEDRKSDYRISDDESLSHAEKRELENEWQKRVGDAETESTTENRGFESGSGDIAKHLEVLPTTTTRGPDGKQGSEVGQIQNLPIEKPGEEPEEIKEAA